MEGRGVYVLTLSEIKSDSCWTLVPMAACNAGGAVSDDTAGGDARRLRRGDGLMVSPLYGRNEIETTTDRHIRVQGACAHKPRSGDQVFRTKLAPLARLELTTRCLEGSCSVQMSYRGLWMCDG